MLRSRPHFGNCVFQGEDVRTDYIAYPSGTNRGSAKKFRPTLKHAGPQRGHKQEAPRPARGGDASTRNEPRNPHRPPPQAGGQPPAKNHTHAQAPKQRNRKPAEAGPKRPELLARDGLPEAPTRRAGHGKTSMALPGFPLTDYYYMFQASGV